MKKIKIYCATLNLVTPHPSIKIKMNYTTNDLDVIAEKKFTSDEKESFMLDEIQKLEAELTEMKQKLDHLSSQLIQTYDTSKEICGPLLFYASLRDSSFILAIRTLCEELSSLKSVSSNGFEHKNFIDLNLILKKCILTLPNVERFLLKYSALHKQWKKKQTEICEQKMYWKKTNGLDVAVATSETVVTSTFNTTTIQSNVKLDDINNSYCPLCWQDCAQPGIREHQQRSRTESLPASEVRKNVSNAEQKPRKSNFEDISVTTVAAIEDAYRKKQGLLQTLLRST
jgi:hypothetical protein